VFIITLTSRLLHLYNHIQVTSLYVVVSFFNIDFFNIEMYKEGGSFSLKVN